MQNKKLNQSFYIIVTVAFIVIVSGGMTFSKDKTDDPDRLFMAAEFFMHQGKYSKAVELYNSVLKQTESAKIYKSLGYSYYKLGLYDKAITALNNAITLDPKIDDGRYYLGLVYKALHQYDEAVSQLQLGLNDFPDNKEILTELGILYGKTGLYAQAIELFKKVLQKNPTNAKVLYYLGVSYYAKRDFINSESYYLKALEQDPNYAAAHKNLGAIYVLQNKNDEAMMHFREYIKLSPGASDIDAVELQIKQLGNRG